MKTQRYSWFAMLLHWVMAVILVWLLWIGWTMVDLPKGAGRSAAYTLHKSLGLLALLLVVVRLGWRQRHPAPLSPAVGKEALLAKSVHYALYAFMLLAPLAGYLASSFTPYAIRFFGIEVAKVGSPDESLNALFKFIHVSVVWGGGGLILLHLAGAAKSLLRRDGMIRRMLPAKLFAD